MTILDKLSRDIEILRQEMYEMIENAEYIISPEIVTISQKLDELITEYNILKIKML